MKSLAGISLFFLSGLAGCASRSPRESAIERVDVSMAGNYETERLLGVDFLRKEGLHCSFDFGERKTRLERKGSSLEVPFAALDPPRPVIPLRLTGPGGTIDRDFPVATGFAGPLMISGDDAEALGIAADPPSKKILLVVKMDGEDKPLENFRIAQVKVEIPALKIQEALPVIWPREKAEGDPPH